MSDDLSHIKDLVPDPKNRRKHTPRNVGMIVDALHKVGAGRSIVIDEKGEVLAGNATIEATGDEIVAVRRTGLTDEQKRDLAIFDNRTGELAEWDTDRLLKDVESGADLSAFFHEDELASLLEGINSEPTEGFTSPDAVPAPRETDIKTGDLFALGDHRLLCGDSTKAEDVALVMDGKKADMVFTDPPYNISIGTVKIRKQRGLVNDSQDSSDWKSFCASVVSSLAVMTDGCIYVCHAPGPDGRIQACALDDAFHCSTVVIWNKNAFTMGMGKYRNRYEPIWFGWTKSGKRFVDDRDLPNVWDINRPTKSKEHPTMKPVELVRRAIEHASRSGDRVGDLFCGSGTTVIASEQLGRKCYTIEIEPGYCQVTIDRWEAFTGKTATKLTSG